jgi:hypothetical protein
MQVVAAQSQKVNKSALESFLRNTQLIQKNRKFFKRLRDYIILFDQVLADDEFHFNFLVPRVCLDVATMHG